MPLSVIKAMRDSTPEEFLKLLLEAVKTRRWDYPRPTPEEKEEIRKLAGAGGPEGGYDSIAFVEESGGKPAGKGRERFIFFEIGRTEPTDPAKIRRIREQRGTASPPAIRVSRHITVPVEEKRWREATEALGVHSRRHPSSEGPSGSISHSLLMPLGAVTLWRPFTALRPEGERRAGRAMAYGSLNVPVADSITFDQFNAYRQASEVVEDYITTLRALKGGTLDSHYEKRLGLDRLDARVAGLDSVGKFLTIYSRHHWLFRQFADIGNRGSSPEEAELERSIATHFGIGKSAFTQYLAHRLSRTLSHPDNRRATVELCKRIRPKFKSPGNPPRA